MIEFPLAIRPAARPLRETAAWFLPGEDPAGWLDSLASWDVPLEALILHVVGRSASDPRALGVLVPVPAGAGPGAPSGGLPFALVADRLYVPAEARFDPDVSEDELAARLAADAVHVLHPTAGLFRFDAGAALRVAGLLAVPPRREAAWDAARPGLPPRPALESVEPEAPPTADEVLAGGGEGIATESPDALRPGGGIGRTLGRLLDRALSRNRRREIDRLLELLERDPDEGLRYALPLGEIGHRGLAPPSDRLAPRRIDFDLARLGGGGRADPWIVSWQERERLRAHYREIAAREARLGRHRRAAYIYAHLLSDLESAAGTLRAGGHHREAAVLYRDRLRRPLAAAACLEEGGLLPEAIAIYAAEGEDEKAGDLLFVLGRRDEAEAAYRRAADRHERRGDLLAAARLLEDKTGAIQDALAVLASAWPSSPQLGPCLEARFDLLGRLGRHEEASRWLAELAGPRPAGLDAVLARSLSHVALGYPDRALRAAAADATRVVVGRRLRGAGPVLTDELLAALGRLDPEDRLLGRDLRRYSERRRERTSRAPTERRARAAGPVEVGRIHLHDGIAWRVLVSLGDLFFAAGHGSAGPSVLRGDWSGRTQILHWNLRGSERETPLLAPDPARALPTILHLTGGPRLPLLPLPRSEELAGSILVGSLPWFGSEIAAAAYGEGGTVWTLAPLGESAVLAATTVQGNPIWTLELTELGPRPWRIASVGRPPAVFVSSGRRLESHGSFAGAAELPGPVRSLVASVPSPRAILVATLEEGAALVRLGPAWRREIELLAPDLPRPVAAVLGDGLVVVLSEAEGRVYDTSENRIRLRSSFARPGGPPVEVAATDRRDRFAVLGADGWATIHRVPPPRGST